MGRGICKFKPMVWKPNVKIKFEFNGENGNYLYIDNVRLEQEEIRINEENLDDNKILIKTIDLLGRETLNTKFYVEIYNDGSVKKHYKL